MDDLAEKQKPFLIIGGVAALIACGIMILVIAVIAAGVFLSQKESTSIPLPDGVAKAYDGIEQGIDTAGFPRLGNADAPVVVEIYASFGCPHCKNLANNQLDDLIEFVRSGQVQIVFKPIRSIADANGMATKGARAAVCAMEQNRFWEMHDIVFYWQGRGYVVNGSRLDAASEALGMDAGQLEDCYDSGETNGLINLAESEFASRGFNAVPLILVNNQAVSAVELIATVENLEAQ